jgi:hypothetical protein
MAAALVSSNDTTDRCSGTEIRNARAASSAPSACDPVASVVRPVRRLVGFARVDVPPGSAVTAEFDVHADLTAFTGRDLRRRVEPGRIALSVAQSAADPGVAVEVDLIGQVRFVGHDRVQSTPHRTALRRSFP